MEEHDIEKTDPQRMAELLSVMDSAVSLSKEELAAIWNELITTPVDQNGGFCRLLEPFEGAENHAGVSLGAILADAHTPVEVLRDIKHVAKTHRGSEQAALPINVLTAVYYACIASASVNHNTMISDLEPDKVQSGLQWLVAQHWIDASTIARSEHALK